jgi:predicted  nucleic acid-binding Zn-ribbon protein
MFQLSEKEQELSHVRCGKQEEAESLRQELAALESKLHAAVHDLEGKTKQLKESKTKLRYLGIEN